MHAQDSHTEYALELYNQGFNEKSIREELSSKGVDESQISEIVETIKKLRHARDMKRGFRLIFIGSIILVVGFVVNVLCFHAGLPLHLLMYASTISGLVICLIGAKYLFT